MIVTQAIIDRFFNNNCSEAEVEAIVTYLSENKDALEKFVSKAEWDAISNNQNFSQATSQQLLQQLKQELFRKQASKVIDFPKKSIARLVAAASIILVITSTFWIAKTTTNNKTLVAVPNTKNAILLKNEKQANNWQIKINTGIKPMLVSLQDGSFITLYPNSVVKYQQPFTPNKRDIILSGDAFFEVAKNKLKPFTVYSGSLSTTALGTSFRVTAFKEGKSTIDVKLYTGKVVIKSTKSIPNWQKDVFLLPGEGMKYSPQMVTALVTKMPNNMGNKNFVVAHKANNSESDIQFINAALPDVMVRLSVLYKVQINYTNTDIQQINFTGSINKSDDIQTILKVIAQMNGLQVTKSLEGFKVTKLANP